MTIYELTPHQVERARQLAQAFIDGLPADLRDVAVDEARALGVPDGIAIEAGDPHDVRIGWAGRVIAVVPREALAGSDPLVMVGELPPVPDRLPDDWTA
ncbi:hypothetical protein [Jiangella muralis]|uniref:hypothetical protein n=1 Tax=Jiangella muralis TaxID=702383 RepID=UPI00069F5B3A|nr:hypothetical protein [Jiangella muralis]